VTDDPVFRNLPQEFEVMESHCGQIEWPPTNWSLIATAGPGAKTKTQCLRLNDRYIYAAQFHIEMNGTPETSRQIMQNFLTLAKTWGGYNPNGISTAAPGTKAPPQQPTPNFER
jgi:GMP synthase-like glutamine amidotransferase